MCYTHLVIRVAVLGECECLLFTNLKNPEILVGQKMVRPFWFSRPKTFQNERNLFRSSPKVPTGIS